jgi:anti-anti-sigma regulatory factor
MLRVTRMEQADRGLTLRIEGSLSGPWVGEFQVACERALAERRPITLDLNGVAFVDREGASLLQAFAREHGVVLANPSPFVREVLGTGTA